MSSFQNSLSLTEGLIRENHSFENDAKLNCLFGHMQSPCHRRLPVCETYIIILLEGLKYIRYFTCYLDPIYM